MEYKDEFPGEFYKIVRRDMKHHSMTYSLGLNVDKLKFNPTGSCQPGGLYFTDLNHLGTYHREGDLVAVIRIPKEALVYREPYGHEWKADRFIIDRFESMEPYWANRAFCLEAVKLRGLSLESVKAQTPELCLMAVRNYGLALKIVKNQTAEICLEAVRKDGRALIYVKEQTPELCFEAVMNDYLALEYVNMPTPEMCMIAVSHPGFDLVNMEWGTPELCAMLEEAQQKHSRSLSSP